MRNRVIAWAAGMSFLPVLASSALAQEAPSTVELTLERMVELTLSNSYEVRFLNLNVEQTRHQLNAENARLRSRVELELSVPTFQAASESAYSDDLGRNITVRTNERRWQAQLSIRQPVIIPFLGYPTNGYLSLNNQVFRRTQFDEEEENPEDRKFTEYYNEYFIQYTQPLFQPNGLKNDLEEAELDFESEEISFSEDVFEILDEAYGEYYQLFENAYTQLIDQRYVDNLIGAESIAQELGGTIPAKAVELDQIRVELANAREQLQGELSEFRLQTAELRTTLGLPEGTIITLNPIVELRAIPIDVGLATQYALELTPQFRELAIERRIDEISLEEAEGEDAFRVDLEFTYGREMLDSRFGQLWNDPSNTYSIDVNAFVPIWDWGERDSRIEASRVNLRRNDLEREESEAEIISNVQNEVRNVEERQSRALTMQDNLALARNNTVRSLDLYRGGTVGVVELLQNLQRERDTANNFLEAYMGWRESLQELQEMTYWDFESNQPIMDRFGIDVDSMGGFGGG